MPEDRLRIVVSGYLVRAPLGGQAWHYLQYLIGLAHLGHQVLYVEDSCFFDDDEYEWFYDPALGRSGSDPEGGLSFAADALADIGFGDRWAFYRAHTGAWHGPAAATAVGFCREADLFVNVSAVNPVRPWLADIPRRLFVDTDPGFTQVRLLANGINRRHALQHNVFATFGENIATGTSRVPADTFEWIPTRQPVVLDAWPVTPGRPDAALSSVLAWQTYAPMEHDGIKYGVKADSFPPFLDLPRLSRERFELALGGDQAPREMLTANGWQLLDGGPRTPGEYQQYLQQSKAEFGIAKQGYVTGQSGWFSERSASYLASGRPVVVQHTGFSQWLTADRGVLAFDTREDAVVALDDLHARYDVHCRAAREVAAEYFDARTVLPRLLDLALRTEIHPPMPAVV